MLKQYFNEMILGLAAVFMALWPPSQGVMIFCATVALLGALKFIERYEHPDLLKLKADVSDLKAKVDQMILRSR